MRSSVFLVLLAFSCKSCLTYQFPLPSDDGKLNWIELATKYGFPDVEEKDVLTQDGYILSLYHIPGDPTKPVLLTHGNSASAYCWIGRGDTSLAITLAKKGYDVWAVNFRGVFESQRHVFLDARKQSQAFFNYTFYEQGIYDLPATIDFILNKTKQEQILGIGHSYGTTVYYVLGSEKPEYNKKIKALISLAPVSYYQHVRGLARFSSLSLFLLFAGTLVGLYHLPDRQTIEGGLFNTTCLQPTGYKICIEDFIFQVIGPDPEGLEQSYLPTLFGHFPDTSSTKMFKHIDQIEERRKFAKFDYGTEGNMVEYGSAEPPEFDLHKVSMKVAVFVGKQDYLSSVPDARRLCRELPNVVHFKVLPYRNFNHLDFVEGKHMPSNLYPYIMPVIDKYI